MSTIKNGIFILLLVVATACTSDVSLPSGVEESMAMLPDDLDYNLHIKPILSDRCFKCHGPDKNKIEAGLQLADRDEATRELESGFRAIVPGNSGKSELVRRIISHDSEEVMPPPDSHLALTDLEKAMLIKWIEQGANYKEHWSLTKIQKPAVPKVGRNWISKWGIKDDDETKWVRNEIDHFILSTLRSKKLSPSPQADRLTLLRRVYMDLTGLPPEPIEIASFLKDSSVNAFEKVVDRLLASPHFGEQQAISWLDLARYADSHGYQDDGMRNAYPYRDWVIKAFNDNLPFDKFVTYQLAGDLLESRTPDMMIATSFNRQHAQTQEGGVVPEEYLTEYVADRTNTFGKAFLGITMECARCHDHKYDPISAKDYYSLYAFFNQNKEFGEVPYNGEAAPTIMIPDKDVEAKLKYIREQIHIEKKSFADNSKAEQLFKGFQNIAIKKGYDEKVLTRDLLVHLDFEKELNGNFINRAGDSIKCFLSGDVDSKPVAVAGKFGNGIQLLGDCGLQLLSENDRRAKSTPERYYRDLNLERNEDFSFSIWFKSLQKGQSGPLITRNNGEFEGYRGYDVELNKNGTLTFRMMYVYPSNGIELQTAEPIRPNEWTHLAVTYDGSCKADGVHIYLNGRKATVNRITNNLTKSILHGEKKTNWSFMPFELGKNFRSTIDSLQLDEFFFYKRRLTDIEVKALHENKKEVSLKGSPEQLYDFYLWNYDEGHSKYVSRLEDLRLRETQLVTDIPEVMVMEELPPGQRRKTFILDRGVYDAKGEEVMAETPLKLGALPEGYPRNRLGLAQWLLQEDNPLFSRVMANRFWMQFFGNGLVKTQEDFGNQGELPSHPQLLDWLASQFRDDNWDTKKFIKRIVMSATYQQSSIADSVLLEVDPSNTWLARGPSYRYTAEQVRDNALAASGLLVRKVGGPSVYPYQPEGLWEALATRNAVSYKQQHGDSLYRRSMYTIWKRSSPPPMMLTFDAPDRNLCTSRRQRTATPLQALITMNDPQFIEAARVLAENTLLEEQNSTARINLIFRRALSREARPKEMQILTALLERQQVHFKNNPEEARKLSNVGEWKRRGSLNDMEVAAYTVVANTILNHDEALIKR